MIINYKGQNYEIVNWEEFRNSVMFLLREGVVNAIQNEAKRMRLFGEGRYIRGFEASYVDENGVLHVDNDTEYAGYLEYGTFDFFDAYGLDTFPATPIKKKDLSKSQREEMPKGMMPFAPVRRVLYSQAKMDEVIRRQFR